MSSSLTSAERQTLKESLAARGIKVRFLGRHVILSKGDWRKVRSEEYYLQLLRAISGPDKK